MTTPLAPLPSSSRDPRPVWAALALWITAALVFALGGGLARLPPPAVAPLIWAPVVALAIALRRSALLRAFVRDLDPRAPVLVHLVRVYYGAAFLVEMSAGRIPARFALVAGPGDIAAGLLALPAAWLVTRRDAPSRALTLGWNALALADMLAVIATAQYTTFALHDGRLLTAFQRMPYALLPTLVVPLVLVSHGVVFLQARRG